ncbi:MAG: hypothetical protein U0Z26_19515 [Anaerolineales bacterium]
MTEDGLESDFAMNVVSLFLLTNLLMGLVEEKFIATRGHAHGRRCTRQVGHGQPAIGKIV